jgi:type IV secretory pathway VirB3-like protein
MEMIVLMCKILLIALIWVYICDLSGIVAEIRHVMAKLLKIHESNMPSLKPFSCSQCMTFWTGLFYVISADSFSLASIVVVCLFAFFTTTIRGLLQAVKEYVERFINKI